VDFDMSDAEAGLHRCLRKEHLQRYPERANNHFTFAYLRVPGRGFEPWDDDKRPTKTEPTPDDDDEDDLQVYFIDNGDFVKIGVTGNIDGRLGALKCASPYDVQVLLTVPGGYDKEQELHERFDHLHHRREWFRKEPDLLQFIEEAARQQREKRAA
jgi:hypothetical protein